MKTLARRLLAGARRRCSPPRPRARRASPTSARTSSRATDVAVKLDGYLRARAEDLYNLDLDRGLTPSGQPLFPVPLGNPSAQALTYADMRLRTDVARLRAGRRPSP